MAVDAGCGAPSRCWVSGEFSAWRSMPVGAEPLPGPGEFIAWRSMPVRVPSRCGVSGAKTLKWLVGKSGHFYLGQYADISILA